MTDAAQPQYQVKKGKSDVTVSNLCMRWDFPSRLSRGCCAVWLTVRWSPPGGDAALSHAAEPSATFGCESPLHPGSHDKPEV